MAEQKTKPTDADVGAFIDAASPAKRREDGKRLREIFTEVTGVDPVMWGPSMVGYGEYHYRSPVNPRFHGVCDLTAVNARAVRRERQTIQPCIGGSPRRRSRAHTARR
ncbi:hypothetical protein [Brevibacterium casei]|uniref:DUF1801 domain-containing protein n=2 Tax=Brevibacterium casei TaxID=33889 RepID=A0A2H1IER6_9MICO|nr:hypothetical protein [Brevibacterium casei]QPR40408.1 hypothetical protein I6G94_06085 [Brevibacterium casei]QPR44563.1 hypothetical protein I6G93_03730 [Brevibacterium casei]SMX73697.1 hypothetical protein BC102111_01191 [Brevibacterium casei CIP 102111]VEW12023.1 Uncharacterised protein [Brevibacterium casei]